MKSAAPSSVQDISGAHAPLSAFANDTELRRREADEGMLDLSFTLNLPSHLIFLFQRDIVGEKLRRKKHKTELAQTSRGQKGGSGTSAKTIYFHRRLESWHLHQLWQWRNVGFLFQYRCKEVLESNGGKVCHPNQTKESFSKWVSKDRGNTDMMKGLIYNLRGHFIMASSVGAE